MALANGMYPIKPLDISIGDTGWAPPPARESIIKSATGERKLHDNKSRKRNLTYSEKFAI
jgi:hypothetical protein